MRGRWLVVLVTAAALIVVPVVVAHRPAPESSVSAADLAGRMQRSANVSWSGLVATTGSLQVPDSDAFANLAQLLGEPNNLRVWWRGTNDWRVDSIRSTGETDLFFNGHVTVRWVFESHRATIAPTSTVRLPDVSDLLPSTLARLLLEGAPADDLSRLPVRRIGGLDAPGVRLEPGDGTSTIDRVDIWGDPASGLPLAVELYGLGDRRPVLVTAVTDLDLTAPDPEITRFVPPVGIELVYQDSVDVAAEANAYAPYDLPVSLGGLRARDGVDPGAVGVYGGGATSLIVVPLRRDVARPLRQRLRDSSAAEETGLGTWVSAGPIGLLLTPRSRGGSFLLAGTVTQQTLERGATELLAGR